MLKPSVQVGEEGGVLTAEFWDCLRLDPAPIVVLRKAFEAHHKRTGQSEVVVDLNGVAFAGSAALGGFLAMRRAGAKPIFCNVDPTVREVFRVSKLEPLFAFAGDRPAALALARLARDGHADGSPAAPTPPRPNTPPPGPAPLRRRKTL